MRLCWFLTKQQGYTILLVLLRLSAGCIRLQVRQHLSWVSKTFVLGSSPRIVVNNGDLRIIPSDDGPIKNPSVFIASAYRPIVPTTQHTSVFYGLARAAGDTTQKSSNNPVGNYTESARSKISQMLNGSVAVTGTTPTIAALPGIRYVCGEVATLDITLPASGCVDITFESGSTATVLTITPPTGQTVKWANENPATIYSPF